MKKITVISGTNRADSYTERVSKYYQQILEAKHCEVTIFSLKELENVIGLDNYFKKGNTELEALITKCISKADGIVFIIPEYNGSFPGILKLAIDAIHPSHWENKNACVSGLSVGRAGNLRGIEHLTGILHYLKMHVYHYKLPLSQVDKIFYNGIPQSDETIREIEKQITGFLKFN